MRGDDRYGLPFAWGSLPLVYDTAAFPTAPESWEVMWDEQYAQQMLWMDDANNSITLAALIVGAANPYQLTDDDFAKIKEKLIAQKKLLAQLLCGLRRWRESLRPERHQAHVLHGRAAGPGAGQEGHQGGPHHPQGEGGRLARLLGTVSAGAKDIDLAHAWINACMDSAVGKILTEKNGYGNTTNVDVNKAAGMTYGDRLSWLETAENYEKRVAVWNEIKAS